MRNECPFQNQSAVLNVLDFEQAARQKVPIAHWAYMATGVDNDLTSFYWGMSPKLVEKVPLSTISSTMGSEARSSGASRKPSKSLNKELKDWLRGPQ